MTKPNEKIKAIKLRKMGFSYNEILEKVDVAKSTLSVWLRGVGLAMRQKQELTEKRRLAQQKACIIWRQKRQKLENQIKQKARGQIHHISKRELWLIGIALYWAEGSKQKEHLVSQGVVFSNSDLQMVKLFLKWLVEICNIKKQNIVLELYIHESANSREAKLYWQRLLSFNVNRIYFKKHSLNPYKKNRSKNYHGLIRIRVRRSTNFNREIMGWTEGITEHCGVV